MPPGAHSGQYPSLRAFKDLQNDIRIIRFFVGKLSTVKNIISCIYTPLQKKLNTWFRSLHDPSLGSAAPRGQKVISQASFPNSH